jgi:transcription antitermination protein NusB
MNLDKDVLRAIRIEVMQVLYQYDLYHSEKIAFIPRFELEQSEPLFHHIIEHLEIIDEIIQENLYNYSLYRLSFLDRSIIRLATYELKYTELPKQIVINEAVELTKIYTNLDDQKQHKFNNKVIDQIAKAIKG